MSLMFEPYHLPIYGGNVYLKNRNGLRLNRGVEQLVARWAHNPKDGGSNPPPATR
jgi:hypothetical protein